MGIKNLLLLFFVVFILAVFGTFGLSGCRFPSAGSSAQSNYSAPEQDPPSGPSVNLTQNQKNRITELDKQIEFQKKRVNDLQKFETEKRSSAVVAERKHYKGRGWIRDDKTATTPDTYMEHGDKAERDYAEAAAAEKSIQQISRQIDRLEDEKQAILTESRGCFPPGTLVKMEDGSFKPISQLSPGDRIMSYDIGYDRLVGKQVTDIYSFEANHYYTINDDLVTTGGERLLTNDGWKTVRSLKIGDKIHINGIMLDINSIDMVRKNHEVYNIHVDNTYNFYVATNTGLKYLVHNTSGGGGGGSGGGSGGGGGGSGGGSGGSGGSGGGK